MAITNEDIAKLEKYFATKYDLTKMEERLVDSIKEFRNDILTHIDGNIGELKAVRDEQAFIHHRVYDNHEKRIKKLETTQNITSL